MPIYFYSSKEIPFGCFSNFSPHSFMLDNMHWNTNEHYYQSYKFVGTPYFKMIHDCKEPREAFLLSRDYIKYIRPDWNDIKIEIMRRGVFQKFKVNDDIRGILISTKEEIIIENSQDDYFWGCGANGTGENNLGKILMQARHDLIKEYG